MRDSRDYGLAQCSLDDLRGGDAASNAARAQAALAGGDTQAHRDALVLGAALALEVTGRVPDARAGVQRALSAIESGAARDLVAKLVAFGKERAP
jgi:anthranilate phosphoribosyltransferase